MAFLYIPYTVQPHKDGVCLFERDVDLKIEYDLPDGRGGAIDWDVTEFHFDGVGAEPGKRIYTKIHRHEPLFHVMYKDLDMEWIGEAVFEALADAGEVDRYAAHDHAR